MARLVGVLRWCAVVALSALSGCGSCGGSGEQVVSGTITLGEGVLVPDDATLELRIVPEAVALGDARPGWPHGLLSLSEPVAEIEFPYEYAVSAVSIDDSGLLGWIASNPDQPWPADTDPQASATFVLCYCTTHAPAYAEEVDLVLEHR